MTITEASSLLRHMLPDLQRLIHNDQDLLDLLEQAANEVAALTWGYEQSVLLTSADNPQFLVPGVREVLIEGFAPHALRVISVHTGTGPLTQITPEGYGAARLNDRLTGPPEFWYQWGRYLGLRPMPDAAWLSNYGLRVLYASRVGQWIDDECPLPSAYDDLILGFAYVKCKIREGQWETAMSYAAEWLSEVGAQPIIVERPETQRSGPPMPPTQRRDTARQRR
jgi:hypothetical protein